MEVKHSTAKRRAADFSKWDSTTDSLFQAVYSLDAFAEALIEPRNGFTEQRQGDYLILVEYLHGRIDEIKDRLNQEEK